MVSYIPCYSPPCCHEVAKEGGACFGSAAYGNAGSSECACQHCNLDSTMLPDLAKKLMAGGLLHSTKFFGSSAYCFAVYVSGQVVAAAQ